MSKNDGGNAFPQWAPEVMNTPEWGMSLRDYFAAKAMTLFEVDSYTNIEWLSGKAYEIADAMIEERAK